MATRGAMKASKMMRESTEMPSAERMEAGMGMSEAGEKKPKAKKGKGFVPFKKGGRPY